MFKKDTRKSPFRTIIFLYVSTILLFSFFYALPVSREQSIPFLDNLFLSASALSGTGLSTINYIETLSTFGKVLLMIEIQMGCIGIMALFTYLLLALGREMSLPQLLLTTFDQNQKGIRKVQSIVLWILFISLLTEMIGFALLYPIISQMYSDTSEAFFVTMFHSVSSFANAGFDLFGSSMISFQQEKLFLIITSLLIFVGVLGFPTIIELSKFKKKKSIFTKANLTVQIYLILFGFISLFILEYSNVLNTFTVLDKVTNSLFFSVSSRNAGLVNFDVTHFTNATLIVLLFLTFIGTSSGSTGGGIRTTTFAVLIAKLISIVKGQQETVMFKKTIPEEDVNKSLLIVFGFLFLFLASTFFITSIEDFNLKEICLEVMSALTTAGISAGITAKLGIVSKIILILLMIIGRIGIISFIYFFINSKKSNSKYIKESIIVG